MSMNTNPQPTTYQTAIHQALSKLGQNGTLIPDKTNTGVLLGECFLWDEVVRYAERMSKQSWDRLENANILEPINEDITGEFQLAKSPSFCVIVKVSNPVRRFDLGALQEQLRKKYKVPELSTKEMYEKAKLPTSPMKSLKIVENL